MGKGGALISDLYGKMPAMGYIIASSSCCSCSLCGAGMVDKESDAVLQSSVT
jgi:hypothetical protein